MIYDYMCVDCDKSYEKDNTMAERAMSGGCPACGSNNTKKIMSTPKFRTCGTGHGPGPSHRGQIK